MGNVIIVKSVLKLFKLVLIGIIINEYWLRFLNLKVWLNLVQLFRVTD